MAIKILEQPGSRAGRSSVDQSTEIVYEYELNGSDNIVDLIAAVDAEAPVSGTDPVKGDTLWRTDLAWRRLGYQHYSFELTYADKRRYDERSALDTGDYKISFSTTGGTARIFTSKETIKGYDAAGGFDPADFSANGIPDYKQAIGVTSDRDVEGVDIITPAMRFDIHYRQPLATITVAYSKLLEEMTGRTNDDVFHGRPAGEVLFTGADGSQGIKDDPVLDYHFLRFPNLTAETIGDITGIAKKGHEYLWVLFQEKEDTNAKKTTKRPRVVYVERVYDDADFASLGIGTG